MENKKPPKKQQDISKTARFMRFFYEIPAKQLMRKKTYKPKYADAEIFLAAKKGFTGGLTPSASSTIMATDGYFYVSFKNETKNPLTIQKVEFTNLAEDIVRRADSILPDKKVPPQYTVKLTTTGLTATERHPSVDNRKELFEVKILVEYVEGQEKKRSEGVITGPYSESPSKDIFKSGI
ncbi:Uncharacterised protein [uncultured archaeon]|nr:Uncharacterised protein [uncultured archaeon]